jgi:hypothetical protein
MTAWVHTFTASESAPTLSACYAASANPWTETIWLFQDGTGYFKMVSVYVPVSMCSSLISQNLGESEEVKCSKCWDMKDHIDKLISELKSTELIIKLLQEDIHLSSPSTKSQGNLTNHVGQNTQVILHRNKEERYTWKEVGRNRAETARRKQNVQTAQLGTDPFPLLTNRYDPLCNYSNGDDTPVHPVVSGIAKPKHAERQKLIKKKRVLKKKKSKVMIFGDSHARGCAAELGHLLKKALKCSGR